MDLDQQGQSNRHEVLLQGKNTSVAEYRRKRKTSIPTVPLRYYLPKC